MYKKMDAADRCDQLQSIAFQLDVLEGLVEGPFVAGGWGLAGGWGRVAGRGGGSLATCWGGYRGETTLSAVRCRSGLNRTPHAQHDPLRQRAPTFLALSSAGEEISLADAALFPTFVFFTGACALALQPGRRVQYIPHLSWPLHLFKAERRVRGMEAPLQLTAAT